ncbi:cobalamin adenosyltransferase [Clostridium sp.]|uniref:cobalamin adenosyltransferase n=1 Tax=Clostridium sp. TaxID=1506 RepID=UPI002FC97B07
MAVLTESEIRKQLGRLDLNEVKEFVIERGQIITPSAKSYLADKKIVLKYKGEENNNSKYKEQKKVEFKEIETEDAKEKKYRYVTIFGTKLDYKPEHMTHLKGNLLVFKDHKRIAFRGRMDTLESKILECQILCNKNGMPKLVEELQEILVFVRKLIRAEVLEEDFNDFTLLGLKEDELREQSHNPKKYFGIGHEFPDYTMGEIVVSINYLRALTREVELAAFEAFKGEYGNVTREDIIKGLNRLSSTFWIMIFKVRTNKYK